MRPLVLLAMATAILPAQKRPVTHEDIFLMKRVGEAAPSPDGKWVVFPVAEPDYDPAKTVSDLWIVPVNGSAAPRRLTATRGPESGVAWSPDSTRIAFTARREGDEVQQVYILPVLGGEAQRVTTFATAVSNPQWRPDGKGLLFESTLKGGRKNPGKSTARVYDSMPVRYWNAWLDGSKPHLFVWEMEGSAPIDLLAGTTLMDSPGFTGVRSGLSSDTSLQPVWSNDGREIVFVATVNQNEMMTAETETHLFRVSREGGEPQRLTQSGSSYGHPQYAPDGSAIYALSDRTPTAQRPYSLTRLVRLSAGGAPQILTAGFDRSVGSFTFAPDGASLVFDAEDDGFSKLFRLSTKGGEPKVLFPVTQGGYGSPHYAGTALVATFAASTQPAEIARIDANGHTLLTSFNAAKLASLDLPKPEHFWFTAKNGKRIHSVLVPPPGLQTNRKYPILVFPHGGPNAMSADSFSTRWNFHLLTSPGYALLMTNYTGSTGFGEKFAGEIEADVLRGPAREILEAVEAASIKFPYLDTQKQCALGASYGGYLMNWFNGHTRQFRCMVNHAGAVNNESQYGANDGGLGREIRMGAKVWETGKGQWMDQSPFRYAAEWKTPTLITQGELDYRVPVGESLMTFKLLQRQGIPARLMVFPDEGHWILKGENNRHHMTEVLAWLKQYLSY
ncbi:MAG TPA: S9 family peptidase [Bryobacteraceae bacterium]|nr:S9 family peptidase [Bryobacteraceae bacterium]